MKRDIDKCLRCNKLGSLRYPVGWKFFGIKEQPEMHYLCYAVDNAGVEPKSEFEKKDIPDNCLLKMEYMVLEQK